MQNRGGQNSKIGCISIAAVTCSSEEDEIKEWEEKKRLNLQINLSACGTICFTVGYVRCIQKIVRIKEGKFISGTTLKIVHNSCTIIRVSK